MPISGLVIVLDGDNDDEKSCAAIEFIRDNRCFTMATGAAGRIPAVLETASESESREQIEWARNLPGVAMVQIAYVNFEDTHGKERNGHGP